MDEPRAKRILVVDDEVLIAETMALILRSSGYDATARNDARSALQECEVRIPDLVLSDVVMPEMNGIDLAIQLEQRYPGCRILLISGLGSSFGLAAEASERGHTFEILSKPIRPAELLTRIEAALANSRIPQDSGDGAVTGGYSPVSSTGAQSEIAGRQTKG
ncbi:MAG TPA: response regulator [Terracidiphilus sp.]|nr:response regulator [Terracidiphilus sp.]